MALDLNSVDLSAVEALSAIKAEQDQLGDRLKTMANKRDQVSPEVFLRVEGDYRRRLDELAAQAAPLIQRAGTAYRALRAELANLESAFAAARLDREEIDFRHALGEFDEAELSQRVKAVDERIENQGKARTQAQALKQRFLAVVAGEAELETDDDDTAQMNAIAAVPSPSSAPEGGATVVSAPIKPAAPPVDMTATIVAPMVQIPAAPAAPVAPPSAVAPTTPVGVRPVAGRPSRNPDATVVFRQGRLEPRSPEAGSVVQTLGLKPVSIGSDSACDLQLSAAGIAKRHVEITMTRAGFSLRDVAASGSVKVNGAVVQERVLAEGDTLLVGPAQFNFRLL